MDGYSVCAVSRSETEPFILGIHYAKRWPSISWAFGLFRGGVLVGVCSYGTPASSTLRRGLCGESMADSVIELNRLCLLDNKKNEASFLVSASLRLLPKGKIVVSFADIEQGHVGTVYQAANFVYCGLSAKRTDWKIRGQEHLHGQTIADRVRGAENRGKAIREMYGDDFYLKPRSRKHRYVFITGSKAFKRKALSELRYKIHDYPKTLKEKPCQS